MQQSHGSMFECIQSVTKLRWQNDDFKQIVTLWRLIYRYDFLDNSMDFLTPGC